MPLFRFLPSAQSSLKRGQRATAWAAATLVLSLGVIGCGKPNEMPVDANVASAKAQLSDMHAELAEPMHSRMAPAAVEASVGQGVNDPAQSQAVAHAKRFIAVRHELQVEAPARQLPDVWAAVRNACERLDCDLLGSELQHETAQQPVSASLTMRVAPKDYAALTKAMGGSARIINDRSASEDKTAQVIDVEAHLKNRTDYRDSLRELLADKGVKRTLGELFEIRDTLSQVQAEIDSALTQRKLLEQETSKQFVSMHFLAERGAASSTAYSPWRGLWRDAGELMAESARTLVQVVAALLPWAALALLLSWPLRTWLRRRKANALARVQGATAQPTSPTTSRTGLHD